SRRLVEQAEASQGDRQQRLPAHCPAVGPAANELGERGGRVRLLELPIQKARLRTLVDDGVVRAAPPDLQRNARAGDLVDEVKRAAEAVRLAVGLGRAADLDPGTAA